MCTSRTLSSLAAQRGSEHAHISSSLFSSGAGGTDHASGLATSVPSPGSAAQLAAVFQRKDMITKHHFALHSITDSTRRSQLQVAHLRSAATLWLLALMAAQHLILLQPPTSRLPPCAEDATAAPAAAAGPEANFGNRNERTQVLQQDKGAAKKERSLKISSFAVYRVLRHA